MYVKSLDMEALVAVKKGDLVHVIWYDAEAMTGWTEEDSKSLSDHASTICETVGFLVKNATKKDPFFIVASTKSQDGGKYEYNAIMKIPKGWVKEMSKI